MNFIQNYFIDKRLSNFITNRKQEQIKLSQFDLLQTICIFATYQGDEAFEKLMQNIAYLEGLKKKVTVIMFVNQHKIPQVMENKLNICIITKNDINFAGQLKSTLHDELIKWHYDLFIDTDTVSDKMTLYLKSLVHADLRAGRNQEYYNYYDLTLCVDDKHTIEEYISNLGIYLSKLQGN